MLQYPILSNHSSQVSATAAMCFLGLSLHSAGYCYHSSSGHRSLLTMIQFWLQKWWKEFCFNASMILPCMQTSLEPCWKGMPIFILAKIIVTGWVLSVVIAADCPGTLFSGSWLVCASLCRPECFYPISTTRTCVADNYNTANWFHSASWNPTMILEAKQLLWVRNECRRVEPP